MVALVGVSLLHPLIRVIPALGRLLPYEVLSSLMVCIVAMYFFILWDGSGLPVLIPSPECCV